MAYLASVQTYAYYADSRPAKGSFCRTPADRVGLSSLMKDGF